jgi:peptidoglycan/xylan/chitin deacetylase (PgdA/CDA1 family)
MNKKFFLFIPLILISFTLFYIFFVNPPTNEFKGIVTLTFDDGYLTQYSLAYPLMEEYGFDGTLFLLANWSKKFEGRELLTFEQAKEMQDNGWEIGSHTLDHPSLTKLSENEIENQLNYSKQILEENWFGVSSVAFPYGDYNEKVLDITKKYYPSARPMEWGFNDLENLDFYKLKSKWITLVHTPEEVCSWIIYARDRDLWLILDFHYIGEDNLNEWSFSMENFKKILSCIDQEGIEVKTIKEVLGNEKTN